MHDDRINIKELEETIQQKLENNLKWSLIFFVFNTICEEVLNNKDKNSLYIKNTFFKKWKKFVSENMIEKDLQTINTILNSPKNIFFNILSTNNTSNIESTEEYQEIYNKSIKNLELFFNKNTSNI